MTDITKHNHKKEDKDKSPEPLRYDEFGFMGYDINGYDVNGLDINGYDVNGYDVNGLDINGLDKQHIIRL